MKPFAALLVALGVLIGTMPPVRAQTPVPPGLPNYQPLAANQLDQLLGPIALYPDPLIAQILAAATSPAQIVLADRYVLGGGDPNQIDLQPWDASVKALARYPNVLKWMDDNLVWTTQLGQAFLNQQPEVMESIQRLRTSANNLGNLQSTPQQQVMDNGGYIEIVPADPELIYVPSYQPDLVFYQAYNGTPFINFGVGFAIGGWLNYDFDWHNHDLRRWDHDHPRPSNWWHEPPGRRDWGNATVWHPNDHRVAGQASRGDRGYTYSPQRPVVATIGHSVSDSPMPRRDPAPQARPAPPARIYQPASHGTFSGIQSPQETRASSDRGHQSIQGSRPAPAIIHGGGDSGVGHGGGGGGGGGHGGSSIKH